MIELPVDVDAVVLVIFVAWVAMRLSRALRARDVDYTRAMAADMARREQESAEERARALGRKLP